MSSNTTPAPRMTAAAFLALEIPEPKPASALRPEEITVDECARRWLFCAQRIYRAAIARQGGCHE